MAIREKQTREVLKKAYPEASFSIINQENYYPFCILIENELASINDRFVRSATTIHKPMQPSEDIFPTLPPNDPFFKYLWNLDDYGRVYGSGKGKVISNYGLQAMKAWKEGVSGKGITVAILSSGVAYEDYYDPETDRHYKKAPDFEKTNFLSTLARDFTIKPPSNHANDWWGLGTQECNIIAATMNNNFGSCGIAYNAKILPIKITSRVEKKTTTSIETCINAIKYAADCGAKVIMSPVSFSTEGVTYRHTFRAKEQKMLHNAVKYAYQKGSLIICSSCYTGKYGVPEGTVVYPGAYPECLSVGLTRFDGNLVEFSNFADYISIYAPGSDDTVDLNKDGISDGIYVESFWPWDIKGNYIFNQRFVYRFFGNPSNSVAEVAAVAALVFEKHPDWTPEQVKTAIVKSAKPFVTLHRDKIIRYGILDAYGAVTYKPLYEPGERNGSRGNLRIQSSRMPLACGDL